MQHEYYYWPCYEKAVKFILTYLHLKFPWDQIIKTIGLILRRNMFDVTIVLFFFYYSLMNMCKKVNDLIHKQQRPAQSQYGILEAFTINFILMIFCWLEGMPTDRLRRKSTSKTRKNKIKAWYRILGTKILTYEEFNYQINKVRKSQTKTNYIW